MTRTYPQHSWTLPGDATEVLLVRHGASQAAVAGEPFEMIEGGHADPPLAPEGEAQAQAVGARLAAAPPDALFVTPLQRTAQTAAPLVAATGLEPAVVPDLREVHLGDWEGGELRVRFAHRDPMVAEIFARQRWDVIPSAEPSEAFAERVAARRRAVVAQTGPGRRAVAVVHGGVIAEIARQAIDAPRARLRPCRERLDHPLVVFGDGRWLPAQLQRHVASLKGGELLESPAAAPGLLECRVCPPPPPPRPTSVAS